tara:strand:- start:21 stop:152 length:132 start_codon:yes stop_codon:yes gene_type:complete
MPAFVGNQADIPSVQSGILRNIMRQPEIIISINQNIDAETSSA